MHIRLDMEYKYLNTIDYPSDLKALPLEALPEVESALVSHESGTAVLTLKEDISDAKLKEIIEDAGYTVI